MELHLEKKPKNPVIIQGFPGFGLVGTITTEFLIQQLKAELIGNIKCDDIPAMIAIHDSKILQPVGIYYDKKTNIVIVHIVTTVQGIEWRLADVITKLAEELDAKSIISLEGVASPNEEGPMNCFYYSSIADHRKIFENNQVNPLKEGIILGVTGALLLDAHKTPLTCVFAETHSAMPDSKASARVIELIDKLLGLNIKTEPLLKEAEKFEEKLKGIMQQSKNTSDMQMKKRLSYVG
ncbi:MAG: PAC2 family protein [Candidatus Woesearchaeota archaeon]|nr:PAC2 family protein [Candidatus Woesearchaeota archaeon]